MNLDPLKKLELEKAIGVINGNFHNAKVVSELADSFERVEKQALELGLRLKRNSPSSPTASLFHQFGDVETVLIRDGMIEAIEQILPRIRLTVTKDGKASRYELVEPEIRRSGQTRGFSSGYTDAPQGP